MIINIIGAGRVGIPLGLTLADSGHQVRLVDKNPDVLSQLKKGLMPFYEPGCDTILKKLTESRQVVVWSPDMMPIADCYIITVGTPIDTHGSVDLTQLLEVLKNLCKYPYFWSTKPLIILRSTIAPGTTEIVENYISKADRGSVGDDFYLAYCPERISEGSAMDELRNLPQIIGSSDENTIKFCELVFTFAPELIDMSPKEAELAKVFTNAYRYIHFAIANFFEIEAAYEGVDFFDLRRKMMDGYPRLNALPMPGLTGGTCLRKDWAMIGKNRYGSSNIAAMAHQINESYADWIVASAEFSVKSEGVIGIYGITFKADSDDLRDSLAVKIYKILVGRGHKVIVHDPNLKLSVEHEFVDGGRFYNFISSDFTKAADFVVIGAHHLELDKLIKSGALNNAPILDPFGSYGNVLF